MAIITATFDTKEKTLTVSMDGADVPDVQEAAFYRDYGDKDAFCCCVTTVREDEDSDVRTMNRLTASENGLVSSVENDVAAFMGGMR